MKYQFINKLIVSSPDQLSEIQLEQLRLAWKMYDEEVDPVELISENLNWFELWNVQDNKDKSILFEYWHFPPDAGYLFSTGTTTYAGISVIQFEWDIIEPDWLIENNFNKNTTNKLLEFAWKNRIE